MSEADKLKNALVWHDYAMRCVLDGMAALLAATDFDANPAERHKARSAAVRDVQTAHRAIEQAQVVREIEEGEE